MSRYAQREYSRNMASNSAYNIEKLSDSNYESWKFQMRSVLIVNDLWSYVSGETTFTEQNEAEWKVKDAKALAMIMLSVSKNQLAHIKRARISKEAWMELQKVHESKGPVRKAVLYKQLYRMRKDTSQSMTQYVHAFTRKSEQLEEVGIKIPNELLSIMLLSSLSSEYKNFCVAIESRDQIPDVESLKLKLIEQETRLNEQNLGQSEASDALIVKGRVHNYKDYKPTTKDRFTKQRTRFNGNCYACGKGGHRASECRTKKTHSYGNEAEDAMPAVALNTEPRRSACWCLDSGATKHMCNDREKFYTFSEDKACKVYTAAEHFVNAIGAGDIKMNVRLSGNKINNIRLRDTMYVPEFRNNLLSVSKMTDNDYTVIFHRDSALVKRQNGSVELTAKRRGQLYLVDSNEEHSASTGEHQSKRLKQWHERFGYLNFSDLKKLKHDDMVNGIDFNTNETEFDCEICYIGKIHQIPYKSSSRRASCKLGLIHSDICGPITTKSIGGARYFVTFIDDYTRYTEVVMLKDRSEVLTAFKNYMLRVKRESGHDIKVLRTDNAKEYISNEFTKLLESQGIKRELTVPHTPQQNGVAERANRTLVEMARCMLLESKLPLSLWAEAINTANFIRNRSPTKALNNVTPLEMWNNRKPYVGFMRIFGSKTISLIKTNRTKFEPKGKQLIMVGYSDESKAYRLWQPGTRSIIKSRDVRFLEDLKPQFDPTSEIFEVPMNPSQMKSNVQDNPNLKLEEETLSNSDTQTTNEFGHDDYYETPIEVTNTKDDYQRELEDKLRPSTPSRMKRGPGRPRKFKTGNPGRPRRLFHEVNNTFGSYEDPMNIEDMLERSNKQL